MKEYNIKNEDYLAEKLLRTLYKKVMKDFSSSDFIFEIPGALDDLIITKIFELDGLIMQMEHLKAISDKHIKPKHIEESMFFSLFNRSIRDLKEGEEIEVRIK